MIYHDATIDARGEVVSHRTHDSDTLVPGAVALLRSVLDRGPGRHDIPHSGGLTLTWTPDPRGVALATLWRGDRPLTTSALLTGADPAADAEAVGEVQKMIVRVWHPKGVEPSWQMATVAERPVILSVVFPWGTADDLMMCADIETVLAAAYFAD